MFIKNHFTFNLYRNTILIQITFNIACKPIYKINMNEAISKSCNLDNTEIFCYGCAAIL